MAEKVFLEGLYSQEVSPNAPEFILGKGAIHVDKMIGWLEKNRDLASERGYINWTLLEGKTGSRYFEVDTWKPQKQNTGDDISTQVAQQNKNAVKDYTPSYEQDINPEDIPF